MWMITFKALLFISHSKALTHISMTAVIQFNPFLHNKIIQACYDMSYSMTTVVLNFQYGAFT